MKKPVLLFFLIISNLTFSQVSTVPTIPTTTGEITDQGQECVTFRANDGTLYALANKASGFRPGDLVRVTGHSALMTTCREASTLIVDKITMLAPAKTGQ